MKIKKTLFNEICFLIIVSLCFSSEAVFQQATIPTTLPSEFHIHRYIPAFLKPPLFISKKINRADYISTKPLLLPNYTKRLNPGIIRLVPGKHYDEDTIEKSEINDYSLLFQYYQNITPLANAKTQELKRILLDLQLRLKERNKVSWCYVPPPKSFQSVERKVILDSKMFSQVTDLVRASIIVTKLEDVKLVQLLLEEYFGRPIKEKQNFDNPKPNGYRDINLVFDTEDDFCFEVQIHLSNIFKVKEVEHIFYDTVKLLKNLNPGEIDLNLNLLKVAKICWGEFIETGMSINVEEFNSVFRAFETWKKDINDENNLNHFIDEIEKFSKKIYQKAWEDYSNENECFIYGINNESASSNQNILKQEGFIYLKGIWQ